MVKHVCFDLQLFAEEKTEKATPHKRKEAREKGQVIKSREISSALILLFVFLAMKSTYNRAFGNYIEFTQNFLQTGITANFFDDDSFHSYTVYILYKYFEFIFPVILVTVLIGFFSNVLQTGFLFTTENVKLKLDRLNPIEGFKRLLSKRSIVEFFKSLIKLVFVGYIVVKTLQSKWIYIPKLVDMEIKEIVEILSSMTIEVGIKAALALLILSGFDYLYQWWEYEQSIKMSKQDIKEEHKQTEGNPQIKSRIRSIQRQMAQRRMMQEIPKADVVITNPTHLAVVLKYDEKEMPAPMVVAKGANLLAERIKQVAIEHNVAIVEDKPLAQLLYKSVDIGEVIPEELYRAVAEILAFVYNLRSDRRSQM